MGVGGHCSSCSILRFAAEAQRGFRPVSGHTASQWLPPQLGPQIRKAGSCLAKTLGPSPHLLPCPRSQLTEAATLYSLVEDQLHVLVTASNHLLRRLELRVRLGHLEAAIHQVKGKILGDMAFYRGHFVLRLKHQAGSHRCSGQGRKHAFNQ